MTIAATPPGSNVVSDLNRGYRCAQPPANFQQPCRADRSAGAAFGKKPPSCLPVRVVKLAAVCRHAATPGVGAESQSDGPEGRWILAGGNAPGFAAAARCAPAGAMERRDTVPAPLQGAWSQWAVSGGIAALYPRLISSSPAGLTALGACLRWLLQICRASGTERGVVAAFGRKPQSCIPMRVVKLAAVFYQEDGDLWTARNTMYAISQNTAPVRNHCRRSFAFLSHPCRV